MQALAVAAFVAFLAPAARGTTARTLVITQADSGKTFRLAVGAAAELHLSSRWTWSAPVVRGNAVDLVQINYFRDPGFSGWSIDTKAPGVARIRSNGTPACRHCSTRSARRFVVTIVVRRAASSG